MAERVDWVEIREPRSGDLMYANIKTGECLWEAPKSATVKKTSTNQWWELYDEKTRRYYYYNAHTKQTEWRKPKESDIITLAKLQNLKGRGSKRRSSSSRQKDGSQRRRSSSRKESSEARGIRDGEQSLPRKYSRHNSGESLSHARKNSRSSHTRSSATQGHSSKDDVGTENDTKGEEWMMQKSKSDEMKDDEQGTFMLGEDPLERDDNMDMLDIPEHFAFDHSNHSSKAGMQTENNVYPEDMDTTTRNIEYLKISGEIAEDEDGEILDTSLGTLIPPPETESGRTSNCSTHQSSYVSDGPLSESETSAHNESFHSCDSKVGGSNPNLDLIITGASPPKEGSELLDPEEIPRSHSFFNKMVDPQGNLRTFSPEERNSKLQRHPSDRSDAGPPLDVPVLRSEGGRRRSSSLDPQAYDNLSSSPHHYSRYDNLKSDGSSDEDSLSLSDRLISGGMSSTTAALVEDCEPVESPSNDEGHDRNSRTYQHQVSDSVLEVPANGKLSNRPERPPQPDNLRIPKPIVRSNTCPVPNRTPITPPPMQTQKFTQPDLTVHHRGLFSKKDNLMDNMLTHSKQPIKKPVLTTRDKQLKKEAIEIFKLVLVYMGDKTSRGKDPELALWEIVTKAWANQPMRDELYFQLVKQTTDNSSSASLERGWELMAVCLAMFPPSAKYHTYLEGYVYNHLKDNQRPVNKILEQEISNRIAQYAENCHYKLEKMAKTGSRKGQRQPTQEEVRAAKRAIFNPSMFGSTLEDTMEMQRTKFPDHKLPWIITCLTEQIIHQNGTTTEGIFRVPGDIDEVNALKVRTDNWTYPDDCNDPNVAASLLKQWFRDLKDPLLDQSVYERCVSNCEDETISSSIVASLPNINRLVLCFIIRFLQIFCKPDVIRVTKMDVNNLAMVWAPNFLRCPSNDPKIIFENTRKEMTFVRTLLNNFDTAFMEGVK